MPSANCSAGGRACSRSRSGPRSPAGAPAARRSSGRASPPSFSSWFASNSPARRDVGGDGGRREAFHAARDFQCSGLRNVSCQRPGSSRPASFRMACIRPGCGEPAAIDGHHRRPASTHARNAIAGQARRGRGHTRRPGQPPGDVLGARGRWGFLARRHWAVVIAGAPARSVSSVAPIARPRSASSRWCRLSAPWTGRCLAAWAIATPASDQRRSQRLGVVQRHCTARRWRRAASASTGDHRDRQ